MELGLGLETLAAFRVLYWNVCIANEMQNLCNEHFLTSSIA